MGGKAIVRVLALVGKEITEVFRRPGAVVSLILGPFLILAIFGLGFHGVRRDLQTIVVVGSNSGLPTQPSGYDNIGARGIKVVAVTTDRTAAEAELRQQQVDLVVVAPDDPEATMRQGKQAQLVVEMNLVDPVQADYAGFLADSMAADVNREIYRQGAQAGEGYTISVTGQAPATIPPDVVGAPTVAHLVNEVPIQPTFVAFFGLAALALVIQHMAVTLLALSVVRERTSGAMDLFRVAPIRASELILGKVLAYGLLGGLVAVVSVALLVGVLAVPMLGSPVAIAGTIALLLVASLGVGLLISIVSDSERQAVQLSLLVLLASMFFSGFVIRTEEFETPIQIASYVLPVTHGIRLLQDLFLRGTVQQPWQLLALAVIAAVLLAASWVLLRREMQPA